MPDDVVALLDTSRKRRHLDPWKVLHYGRDPLWAEWALLTLHRAGFGDIFGIARDFGWVVPKRSDLALALGYVDRHGDA